MTDLPEQHRDDDEPATTADTDATDTDATGTDAAGTPASPPPASPPPASPPPTPAPQTQWPQQSGGEQRNWAVGAHLSALAASLVTGLAILGPLVVYLIKKDEDRFIAEHAREALNFQLTWLIGGFVATIVAVIVTIVTVGLGLIVFVPAAIGFVIAWLVFMIKAAMAASRGEYYRYPLTVRLVS